MLKTVPAGYDTVKRTCVLLGIRNSTGLPEFKFKNQPDWSPMARNAWIAGDHSPTWPADIPTETMHESYLILCVIRKEIKKCLGVDHSMSSKKKPLHLYFNQHTSPCDSGDEVERTYFVLLFSICRSREAETNAIGETTFQIAKIDQCVALPHSAPL
jgi:hypothetical protein